MPDVSAPGNGVAWPYDRFYQDAPMWSPSGVYGDPASTPFVGDLALALNGLNWAVKPGRAHVRGRGYERVNDNASGASATNSGTTPRIDRLVLRRDRAADTCGPVLLQGTPASSPTKPMLQRSESGLWDLPLYSWTVQPNNVTTLANVVDERFWLGTLGGQTSDTAPSSYAASFAANDVSPLKATRDYTGVVRLMGLMKNVQSIANPAGTWFTLPVGWRPFSVVPIVVFIEGGSMCSAAVNPDGTVVGGGLFVGSGTVPTPRYWSFDAHWPAVAYNS